MPMISPSPQTFGNPNHSPQTKRFRLDLAISTNSSHRSS
ncbi:hypothetical protein SLEP1_g59875 [Rubroshorea leprosula]|uniref:Uncharacterized protein n=1 Tax=Rubroshorea leprosula TaxID=152421 RepID=A0AAV5MY72_9ROSI|nr:hypothetical protein SLEP1_g59875 [Rubroshorea leprosula]